MKLKCYIIKYSLNEKKAVRKTEEQTNMVYRKQKLNWQM